MNDFMQATVFKAEIKDVSERTFIRVFEKKWREEDLFSVNLMLMWAEDMLSPATLVRFNELYQRLSLEGRLYCRREDRSEQY